MQALTDDDKENLAYQTVRELIVHPHKIHAKLWKADSAAGLSRMVRDIVALQWQSQNFVSDLLGKVNQCVTLHPAPESLIIDEATNQYPTAVIETFSGHLLAVRAAVEEQQREETLTGFEPNTYHGFEKLRLDDYDEIISDERCSMTHIRQQKPTRHLATVVHLCLRAMEQRQQFYGVRPPYRQYMDLLTEQAALIQIVR